MPSSADIDKNLLLHSLIKREKIGTTTIGNGIAIPHVQNHQIIKPGNFKGNYIHYKIKGDGKTYKFRLRENYRSTNYSSDFKTLKNKWIEIEIKTNQLKPMFMGYYSNRSPKLNTEKISSLGFQISDKQKGNFNLEIMYVKAIY